MSIVNKTAAALAILALLLCSADTVADGISNPTLQAIGDMGGDGPRNATPASGGGGGGACGDIDLSTGCVAAMFGGL